MRSVPEWVGRSDDDWPPPPRIRDRIFDRFKGHCYRCTRHITVSDTWSLDHVIAICNGGANRESNLAPICGWCKPTKDAADAKIKAKGYKIRKRARGIKPKYKRPVMGSKASGWKHRLNGRWERR